MESFVRFVCFVFISCSINIVLSKDAITETVSKHGVLSVDGVNLVDQNGEIFQLKGMGLGWSVWWPQYYNAASIKGIHQLCHANAVRAALSVGTDDNNDYLKNPDSQMKLVEAVIEAAIEQDIYVLVDWHQVGSDVYLAEAKDFFDKISKKYGKYPNIIYETFNEPVEQSWSNILKPYHEAVIKTIRANDPNNVIILGTPNWSQRVDEAAADPVTTDKKLLYTLHLYAGTHTQWLRDTAQAARDLGLPIIATEYGVSNVEGNGIFVEETRLWLDWLDERNISYINYDIADKVGEDFSALKPGTTADHVCDPEYLTESGKMAVEQIEK